MASGWPPKRPRTVGQNTALVQLAYTAQILAARMEQGRLSEVITTLRQLDSLDIVLPEWRAMLVGALADAGQHAEASTELHKLLDDPLTGFPAQASSLAIRHLTEACRLLGDSDGANALLPHVEPWAGQILVVRDRAPRSTAPQTAASGTCWPPSADSTTPSRPTQQRPSWNTPPASHRSPPEPATGTLERSSNAMRTATRTPPGRLLDDVINVTERLGMSLLARQAIEARV